MGISSGGDRGAVKSTINVTPLVDIVLVLLIIFLVTTPIMLKQITIEVPRKLEQDESQTEAAKQITVLLRAKGDVVISTGIKEDSYPRVELTMKLRDILKDRVKKIVFVDFEDDVKYGDAVEAMDSVKMAGATTVALKVKDKDEKRGAEGAGGPALPPGP